MVCPGCRGVLEGDEPGAAQWVCGGCGRVVPVVGGVPRLAAEGYVASFGRQWNRYDVARPEEDEEVFRVKTGLDLGEVSGWLVLDAGCGGGRYARLMGAAGARVVGVDLSSAVEKAAWVCRGLPNVRIVQGDLLDLAVADGVFDLVVSIGVLHHSSDPRRGFREIARKVKRGGRLVVWLYRRNTLPQEVINWGLRAVTTRLPGGVLEGLSVGLGVLGGVPVVNRVLNKVVNFSNHRDWELRVCDNYDWYAPRYQSHHTVEEVRGWFEEEGFGEVEELGPLRRGRVYEWAYRHNLIVGSGVNLVGRRV